MGDPVTLWQIITKEPGTHAEFYSAVFGWKIRTDNPLGYLVADPGSPRGIGGGFWPAATRGHGLRAAFPGGEEHRRDN